MSDDIELDPPASAEEKKLAADLAQALDEGRWDRIEPSSKELETAAFLRSAEHQLGGERQEAVLEKVLGQKKVNKKSNTWPVLISLGSIAAAALLAVSLFRSQDEPQVAAEPSVIPASAPARDERLVELLQAQTKFATANRRFKTDDSLEVATADYRKEFLNELRSNYRGGLR